VDELRFLVETYLDAQKDRIRFDNRVRDLPKEYRETEFFKNLKETVYELERSITKRVEKLLMDEPLYTRYLRYQKGVGPMLAAYLIAWLCREREFTIRGVTGKIGENTYRMKWKKQERIIELPPYAKILEENLEKGYIRVWMPPVVEVAENPSDLHKYCGLAPGSKLTRGERVSFNPKVKALMWKILRQLLMAGGEWARIYAKDKYDYAQRCPEPEKGSKKLKVHLTAKNIVMRKFMTNLWLVYRWMHGLPTTDPYPVKLGLQHNILQPFIETKEGVKYLSREDFT